MVNLAWQEREGMEVEIRIPKELAPPDERRVGTDLSDIESSDVAEENSQINRRRGAIYS